MTSDVNLQPRIHKLPPEILCQIFIAHGTKNNITIRKEHRQIPGFKISAVCSYWRSVAVATTELWNCIGLVLVTSQWHPQDYALLQRLLNLSADSALFVSIDILGHISQTPDVFRILCDHSSRWQTLSVVCIPSPLLKLITQLSLDSLIAFELTTLQSLTDLHPLNAPKLHKLVLHLIDPSSSSIPWPQTTDLTVRKGYIPQILEILPRTPNLSKLNIKVNMSITYRSQPPIESNLTSLTVSFRIEQAMQLFLDTLFLPNLTSLTLVFERDHTSTAFGSVAEENHWSRTTLPSLLTRSRSSAILTSLTLQEVQIHPIDLISLLYLMPNLRNLSLSEPSDCPDLKPRMINHLLSTLTLHSDGNSSESGLVTNLTSLSLGIRRPLDSDFNLTMLLDLITSRPNLRTVYLKVHKEAFSPSESLIRSFVNLRKSGVVVGIEDLDGDVLFGPRRESGKSLLE